jgi:hypothetical protein
VRTRGPGWPRGTRRGSLQQRLRPSASLCWLRASAARDRRLRRSRACDQAHRPRRTLHRTAVAAHARIEEDWARTLGRRRFVQLRSRLKQLAGGALPTRSVRQPSPAIEAGAGSGGDGSRSKINVSARRVPIVQRPRTWPFQGQNTGSNPVGDANAVDQLGSTEGQIGPTANVPSPRHAKSDRWATRL